MATLIPEPLASQIVEAARKLADAAVYEYMAWDEAECAAPEDAVRKRTNARAATVHKRQANEALMRVVYANQDEPVEDLFEQARRIV